MQLDPIKILAPVYYFLYDWYHQMSIDWHKHLRTAEAGAKSMEQGIHEAQKDRCKAFAATDHDTISPLVEFVNRYKIKRNDQHEPLMLEAGTKLEYENLEGESIKFNLLYDMYIIPGVELSTTLIEPGCHPKSVHILGLYVPLDSKVFEDELKELYTYPRNERLRDIANRIQSIDTRITIPKEIELFTRTEIARYIAQDKKDFTPPILVTHFRSLYEHLEAFDKAVMEIQDAENREKEFHFQYEILKRLLPEANDRLILDELKSRIWKILDSTDKAFLTYVSPNGPKSGYVAATNMPSTRDTIEWVKEFRGGTILAHPAETFYKPNDLENVVELIEEFKDFGMVGLEVMTHRHTAEMMNFYNRIAKKLDLVATGGSDDQRYVTKAPISSFEKIKRKLIEMNCY